MLESLFQLAGPVQALCATLMTWALTSLGACVVFLLRKPNRNVMDAMLGLAGGVMVAASFWSLLSPSIDMAEAQWRPRSGPCSPLLLTWRKRWGCVPGARR